MAGYNTGSSAPYSPAYAASGSNTQTSQAGLSFPSVPTTNPMQTNNPQNSQLPAYMSLSRPTTPIPTPSIPSYASTLPRQQTQQPHREQQQEQQNPAVPLYASNLSQYIPPTTQTSTYGISNNNQTQQQQEFHQNSSVPSAYNNPPSTIPNNSAYMPSYASISPNSNVTTNTAYSSYLGNVAPSQPSNNAPASYRSSFQPKIAKEDQQLYGSDLQNLYKTIGQQTSYLSLVPRAPVAVAADSLRQSFGVEVIAKTNDDGSTEGWLWQQRDSGTWDRLYFILDDNQLLGFKHFPQKAEEASPIQGLQLKTGMIVTRKFASYCGVRGCCFSIQVQPKSSNVVVFDTVNDADRSIWVAALEKATKTNEISAWVPWEIEKQTAQLEKEQELKQLQHIEDERLQLEKERMIQKHLENVQKQEIAKVTDSTLAEQLEDSYNNQKEIETLEKQAQRLRDETIELNTYKQQVEESMSHEDAIAQSQDILVSISEREMKLQLLEEEKLRKQEEQKVFSFAEELNRLKQEQEEILKREEERIRYELTIQFEKEAETRKLELEEKLRKEKNQQKDSVKKEEMKQVMQWLNDNPTWVEYYKNLGVTMEELNDPHCLKLIKKMIKDTARFVISSGVEIPDTPPTPLANPEDVSPMEEDLIVPESTAPESTAPESTAPESNAPESNVPEPKNDEVPDFSSMLPPRAPPPPPSDDESDEIDLDQLPASPAPDIIPDAPNDVPPPPPVPAPPPPPPVNSSTMKITKASRPSTQAPKESSMMDQITGFQFKEQNENKSNVERPVMKKEPSMLDQIHSFKFKERKAVPTIEQLPKQNQDSLTALLSNQLTIFRTKLREDTMDDDDDDADDYWD